jgi:2-oxoisovalerate dehydrogenase E2 component (dihydrolipoyl transacylase)
MGRHTFILPDVGEGIVEAEITEWYVKPGDMVDDGDLIVDIMTDKATVEIPAPVAGRVVATTGEPGDMIAVGTELAVFEVEGEGNGETPVEPAVALKEDLVPTTDPEPEPEPEPKHVQEEEADKSAAATAPISVKAPTPITRAPEISRRVGH